MFYIKVSFALSLSCCALAGAVMFLLRILAAPLWLICGAVIALTTLLGLAAFHLHDGSGRYQENAPAHPPRKAYPLAAAALCFFLVTLLRLPQLLQDAMIFSLLLVLAPLLAAAACALRFFCGEHHPLSGPLALLPIFFLCIHLMTFYRANSNHPDAGIFGYEIITLSLLLMGLYVTSSSKYKLRHAFSQRIWAMLPLTAAFMELFMLLFARELLYQAEDMNTATLLSMAGACALLIMPLLSPIQPVALPKAPKSEEDDPSEDAASADGDPEASETEAQPEEDAPADCEEA